MNTQIYEQASDWLVEFRTEEVDAATRQRFEAWLSISPQHVRAYLELANIWETVNASEPADTASVDAIIARAKGAGNVVAFEVSTPGERYANGPSRLQQKTRRVALPVTVGTAAAFLLAAVGAGLWFYTQQNSYSTAVGEQRSILLADGSTIELNARSRIRVRFSRAARSIELLSGQALFDVASDKARPFTVKSGETEVRAIGTQFDVNQRKHGTIVTVIEGAVSISAGIPGSFPRLAPQPVSSRAAPGSAAQDGGAVKVPAAQIFLTAGEQAVLASDAPPAPHPADIFTATAWTHRRLIFDSTPLNEVVEDFNRNSTRPLAIEGKGLEDFRISGAFSSSDPEPLLRFLRAQGGIEIIERADKIVISRSP